MERPVKERLVGAAVLMAAAVILIPEMLSGPGRDAAEKQAETSAGPIKTYTIDLNQSRGASPPAATLEERDSRAPPPEETDQSSTSAASVPPTDEFPAAQPQASPESVAQVPAVTPEARTPASSSPPVVTESPPPRQLAAEPARAQAPATAKVETQPQRPVASAPSAPTSSPPAASVTRSGWAVQLGSYASEATAERLRNEWRAKGLDAFVMPVKSGGKTLYRVRIGPTKDRAAADAALKTVKSSIPGAAVVAHP